MAPKSKLPQKRKLVRGLEKDVRRKRIAVEPSSTPTPVLDPAPASSQSPLSPSKIPLSNKKVKSGKNIDFKFFEKEGFSIGSKIKSQGWEFYCLLKKNTYIDLVRKFYLNLSYCNGTVKSTIKSVDIILDPVHLG